MHPLKQEKKERQAAAREQGTLHRCATCGREQKSAIERAPRGWKVDPDRSVEIEVSPGVTVKRPALYCSPACQPR